MPIYDSSKKTPDGEPAYITVQHCLIGFDGSIPGMPIPRSKSEAKALAEKLFEEAKSGADFESIIVEHTDDSPPGIYKMANDGFPGESNVYRRGGMVAAFGNVGFPLEVGEYGLAVFHESDSPYGWHIIKRID